MKIKGGTKWLIEIHSKIEEIPQFLLNLPMRYKSYYYFATGCIVGWGITAIVLWKIW